MSYNGKIRSSQSPLTHMRIKETDLCSLCVMVHDTIYLILLFSVTCTYNESESVWMMGVVGVRVKCAHVMDTV